METDTHTHTNRLIDEKSPYLLQHAHNPVDWYPWGEEAFARARNEDKPIFLSIGYSTCHWCHVMERESFENEEIAAILNEHFVAIKVDREERPDVDNVYMAAVQAMTGRGGWPLSAFLTPDRHPFYAGTYFPPEDAYGRPGFRTLLHGIADGWRNRRDELLGTSERVLEHLSQTATSHGGVALGARTLSRAAEQLAGSFDAVDGGFGQAPKFPRSHSLSFLLRQWRRTGDDQFLRIVEVTLERMARGGMADHLGGGFHRYSTDARWLVPHFEKMLYDQALLARTYLEAYQVTGNERYADVARGIFTYVLRDLSDPEGGFLSAEDADSEGEEGTFYVWRPAEIVEVLGEETGKLFGAVYGVTDTGNFEHATSILHLPLPFEEAAAQQGMDVAELEQRLAAAREKLLDVRSRRQRPHLDDKVITSWNALMISAFTVGARVLDEPRYAAAAERAARFILDRLRTEEGLLLRRYRDGEAAFTGYIDDYAFFLGALIDLYETTFDTEYLAEAKSLAKSMQELFWDQEDGGFLFRARTGEELVIDTKEIYDGAEPSGNSVAALALLRLGDLTGEPELTRQGSEVLSVFSADIGRLGSAVTQMLAALDFAIGPTMEVVVAGDPAAEDTRRMVRELYALYLPNAVLALRPDGEAGAAISALAPFLSEQRSLEGRATAYVCRNHACSLPTADLDQMLELIEPRRRADDSP